VIETIALFAALLVLSFWTVSGITVVRSPGFKDWLDYTLLGANSLAFVLVAAALLT